MSSSTEEMAAPKAADAGQTVPMKNGRHDVITHRLIVLFLGLTVVFTGLNITILEALGKEPPNSLANLGSVAIGALAMCLSSIMNRPS